MHFGQALTALMSHCLTSIRGDRLNLLPGNLSNGLSSGRSTGLRLPGVLYLLTWSVSKIKSNVNLRKRILTSRFYVAIEASRSTALHALNCHGSIVLGRVGRSAGPRPEREACAFALERVVVLVGRLHVFAGTRTFLFPMALLLCIPEGLGVGLMVGNSVFAKL